MLVCLASFSMGLSDTLRGGTIRLVGAMNNMGLAKCSGPSCFSTWNLMLHHKTFLFRNYYICIFICIHILLKKLKYKNIQNKE